MDIKEAALLKGDIAEHWYYRAKLAALRAMVDTGRFREILDVGAGMGFFSREMLRRSDVVAAVCVDPGYSADHDETVGGKALAFRREAGKSTADLVLMMDVLEHVPDDVALLRDYVDRVAPGTAFVVTVPAFNFLWSGHDVFLEHYRRYTLNRVEAVVRDAGLRIERGCYFYGALFPLVVLVRLIARLRGKATGAPRSDMRPFGPFAKAVLWTLCRAELPLFKTNRLAGLTAMVLAVKP